MRLFVAVLLPSEIKQYIRDISRLFYKEKRNLKFVQPEQLHMTMKFLGNDVSEESLKLLIEKLEKHRSELKNIKIELGDVIFGFRGQIRPTVLSVLIKSGKELNLLTEKINLLVRDADLQDTEKKKDRKTLVHHITVARAKSTVNRNFKRTVLETLKKVTGKRLSFECDSISFLQSTLTKNGPEYREMGKVKLT